ncbi:glycosyltransferase family 2 protein [Aeromonas taiwanensis]
MKILCLMMHKNERTLLKPWIDYHSMIFGMENIHVYDNGSTDQECIETLRQYEIKGLHVEWNYTTKADYENRGHIFSEKIKSFDRSSKSYDFYIPLDCDEFIAYERSIGDLLLDKKSIELELSRHIGSQETLSINAGYDNNPLHENFYFRSADQRKCFFYKDTCLTLDQGFHIGKSRARTGPKKTQIVYIHYHYKEFNDYQFSAKQKLIGRVSDFSTSSLERHRDNKGAGYHLIGALLTTESNYYESFHNRLITHKENCFDIIFASTFLKGLGLRVMAPENIKESFKGIDKTVKSHGFIDSFSINGNSIKLIGWVVSSSQEDVGLLSINFGNSRNINISTIIKYDRPDVAKAISGSYMNCGIIAEKELADDELMLFNSAPSKIVAYTKNSSSMLVFNPSIFYSRTI